MSPGGIWADDFCPRGHALMINAQGPCPVCGSRRGILIEPRGQGERMTAFCPTCDGMPVFVKVRQPSKEEGNGHAKKEQEERAG